MILPQLQFLSQDAKSNAKSTLENRSVCFAIIHKSPFKKLPIIDVVRQTRKGECSLPFEKNKGGKNWKPKNRL